MKIKTDHNVWFTSDTHYGHTNICKGVSQWDWKSRPESVRDFLTLDDMNTAIVNGINLKVAQDDWLIHNGDWSFGGFDNIEKFRNRIICKNIILILGNHDHHIKKDKHGVRDLFTHVFREEQLLINKQTYHLYHYPVISWFEMGRGTFMLHGHVHSTGDHRFGPGRTMDVGIDGSPDFGPYQDSEIIRMLGGKPLKDHHNRV